MQKEESRILTAARRCNEVSVGKESNLANSLRRFLGPPQTRGPIEISGSGSKEKNPAWLKFIAGCAQPQHEQLPAVTGGLAAQSCLRNLKNPNAR